MDLLIHIIDDDNLLGNTLKRLFGKKGHRVILSRTGEEALKKIEEITPDLILLDLNLPDIDGLETLKRIQKLNIPTPVIMVSGYGTVETAVQALKLGAWDFLTKPLDITKINTMIQNIFTQVRLQKEVQQIRTEQQNHFFSQHIIGQDPIIKQCYSFARSAAGNDKLNILITGESGTGKEFIAKYIHYHSLRHDKPLITVNCSALPKELVESELFGYEKGAFTGAATKGKPGRIELAEDGSLFLDEIGDLHLEAQSKILRFLQEKEIQRIGSPYIKRLNVRVIAATNQNLEDFVQNGQFREDLYYRLNVMRIHLPPLRARKKDVLLFALHFIHVLSQEFGKKVLSIMPRVEEILQQYDWPGNIRELHNVIERAVHLARGPYLTEEHIMIDNPNISQTEASLLWKDHVPLQKMEKEYVNSVLASVQGNKSQAAQILEISRARLRRIISEDEEKH